MISIHDRLNFFWINIVKDIPSVSKHMAFRILNIFKPRICKIPSQEKTFSKNSENSENDDRIANVTILIPGQGAHPSCYYSLIKSLKSADVDKVHAISCVANRSNKDQVPSIDLHNQLETITSDYIKSGYKEVRFTLVGHSLGGMIAAKYIWSEFAEKLKDNNGSIVRMITLASRLHYLTTEPNKLLPFAKPMKEDIEAIYKKYQQNPEIVDIFTISGAKDKLVPQESVHFHHDPSKMIIIKNAGHNSLLFSQDAHQSIINILRTKLPDEEAAAQLPQEDENLVFSRV